MFSNIETGTSIGGHSIYNLFGLSWGMFEVAKYHKMNELMKNEHNVERTVFVDTDDLGAYSFDLTETQKKLLFDNGYKATMEFIKECCT